MAETGTAVVRNRKQAALAVTPFLLLGLADVVLLLEWGLNPLWGFMILPPILFVSVLAWLGFRTGFVDEDVDGDADDGGSTGGGGDAGGDAGTG